jgi:capsular polysaccharide transport system permease protein
MPAHAQTLRNGLSALRTQSDVVGALILRETHTRFGRTRLGYIWVLIEPVAHAVGLSIVHYTLGRRSPLGGSMALFFMTGLLPFFLWSKVSYRLVSAFTSDRPLLNVPAVTHLDILCARALLEGATWLIVSTILIALLVSIGFSDWPFDLESLFGAVAATFLLAVGVGMINATLTALLQSWHNLFSILTRPLYLASGIFYLVDQVPATAQAFLVWNPLVHAIEWTRTSFYPAYGATTLDKAYLVQWAVCTCVLGLVLERLARRKVEAI